jgi:hypothetical protein
MDGTQDANDTAEMIRMMNIIYGDTTNMIMVRDHEYKCELTWEFSMLIIDLHITLLDHSALEGPGSLHKGCFFPLNDFRYVCRDFKR